MPEIQDDPTVGADAILWRRIFPGWIEWGDGTAPRPISVAFIDRHTKKVSVSVGDETTVFKMLRCYPSHSIAAIQASVVRASGYPIVRERTQYDPAHAFFPCPTGGKAREFSKAATWVILRRPALLRDRLAILFLSVSRAITVFFGWKCPPRQARTPEA